MLLACVLAAASPASALTIPSAPSGRVSDFAGLLSAPDRARIEKRLVDAEQGTTTQLAVAVFPGLEGEDPAEFTNKVFDAWRLGRARDDNGVLLAVYVADRKVRIEVGYGFEGKLTDALSRRIIEREIVPRFRENDWAGGIEAGCVALVAATRGEYAAAPRKKQRRRAGGIGTLIVLLFLLFVLPRVLAGAQAATYGSHGVRRGRNRWRNFGGWGGGPWIGGGLGGGFGGSGGGSGGGFSGGGFSGGGGMSGGGGATGSW